MRSLFNQIKPLDPAAMAAARERQDQLTKPQGSLGRLEELSVQMAGIMRTDRPRVNRKVVTVMAGDHGVVAEGVSAFPQAVTPQMVLNFLAGGAAINVLARQMGARVVVADLGVASELPAHPQLVSRRIGAGTANIAKGPAMSRQAAEQALWAGYEIVEAELAKGLDILATGDMGIGNTTPSAAIAAAITGKTALEIVGRGTGVDDAGLSRKRMAVESALRVNKPKLSDGIDVLAKLGGFEIGGLAGAMLAAAANGKAVVIDGFISSAAALVAATIDPRIKDYLIASHASQELGHKAMLGWLGLKPLLDLQLRLGEGSGAVLALPLVEAACRILDEMATFGEAGVSGKA